jgi:putative metallohydrolase (TIGR04338 family)
MPRPRDSYKQRVYEAEAQAMPIGPADRFKSLEDTEEFIRKVLGSRWRKKRFPYCAILTMANRKSYHATATGHNINLPAYWAWTKQTALHETAHYLLRQSHNFHTRSAHGREYCKLMLELVRRFMGPEAGRALRAEFVKDRIPYRSRKRLTPETIERLKARGEALAAYRKNGNRS